MCHVQLCWRLLERRDGRHVVAKGRWHGERARFRHGCDGYVVEGVIGFLERAVGVEVCEKLRRMIAAWSRVGMQRGTDLWSIVAGYLRDLPLFGQEIPVHSYSYLRKPADRLAQSRANRWFLHLASSLVVWLLSWCAARCFPRAWKCATPF